MSRALKMIADPFAFAPRKGGGGGGTTTTVQEAKSEPWSVQQPYLREIFGEAQAQYQGDKPQFYGGQTYADFDPATQAALTQQQQRAMAGNPLTPAAQGEAQKQLAGDYLMAGNPYMAAMSDRIAGDVRRNVDSAFASGGRYGSGLHAEALARGTGDALAPVYMQNYANERNAMTNAMGMAPGLAQQDYFDIGQLANVGGAREAQAQRGIDEAMMRHDFQQNQERLKLADYLSMIQGNYGGQTQATMTQPLYRNSGASTLGGIASIAGLGLRAASLF